MKGMILAAGLGTRMRPITFSGAKPSLPLFNRPFIVHTVEYLRRFGIDEIAVNLHHRPDSIRFLLKDGSDLGVRVHYSYEKDILGTAGGFKKIEEFFQGERFVLINSDFVSDIDLEKAIDDHARHGSLATLVVMKSRTEEYSKVLLDGGMNVRAIGGDQGEHLFCGLHIIEPEIFRFIPEGEKTDINRDVYHKLIKEGRHIRAYVHDGFWYEFGDLKKYLQGHRHLAKMGRGFLEQMLNMEQAGKASHPGTKEAVMRSTRETPISMGVSPTRMDVLPPVAANIPFFLFSEKAYLDDGAHVSGMVVADSGCRIEEGASVKNSVIHQNAVIRSGASLSDCIIGEGVVITEGLTMEGAAVARSHDEEDGQGLQRELFREIVKEGDLLIKKFLP